MICLICIFIVLHYYLYDRCQILASIDNMREPHFSVIVSVDALPEPNMIRNKRHKQNDQMIWFALISYSECRPLVWEKETSCKIYIMQWSHHASENVSNKEILKSHYTKWCYDILIQWVKQLKSESLIHYVKRIKK